MSCKRTCLLVGIIYWYHMLVLLVLYMVLYKQTLNLEHIIRFQKLAYHLRFTDSVQVTNNTTSSHAFTTTVVSGSPSVGACQSPSTLLEEMSWRGKTCLYYHFGGSQLSLITEIFRSANLLGGQNLAKIFIWGHCPSVPPAAMYLLVPY